MMRRMAATGLELRGAKLMCTNCDSHGERIPINRPREYCALVEQLQRLIATGALRLVRGTCELDAVSGGKPWPGAWIEHVCECPLCGRRFRLYAETYHGSGGAWEALEKRGRSGSC